MIAHDDVARDVLIVACAISAGIHGALTPGHLSEGAVSGVGFLAATLALAALAIGLTLRPDSAVPLMGAGVVLAGLIGSYALATTTGLPLLHPRPEPIEGLALFTKAIELLGVVGAVDLLRRRHPTGATAFSRPKGTLA